MSFQLEDSPNWRTPNSQIYDLDETKNITCFSNLDYTELHLDEGEEIFRSFTTSNFENHENLDTQEMINTLSGDLVFHDSIYFESLLGNNQASSSNQENEKFDSSYVKFNPLYGPKMLPENNNVEEKQNNNAILTETVKKQKVIQTKNVKMMDIEVPLETEAENIKIKDELNILNEAEKEEIVRELQMYRSIVSKQQEKLNYLLQDLFTRIMKNAENERLISNWKIQKLQEELKQLEENLQTVHMHINNSKASFNNVSLKYEKKKEYVYNLLANQDKLEEAAVKNRKTINAIENKYQTLKAHAVEQLEIANETLKAIQKQHKITLAIERAKVARAELQYKSAIETAEQNNREICELKKIVYEFVTKNEAFANE